MVRDDDRYIEIYMHLAPQAGKTGTGMQQIACRDFSQRDDKSGTYQLDLPCEVRLAALRFVGSRFAVPRRAALYNISYKNIAAPFQINSGQHVVKQLASQPDERLSSRIFLGAGAFSHAQPARVWVADPEYRTGARLAQWTCNAIGYARLKLLPPHPQNFCAPVFMPDATVTRSSIALRASP